MKHILKQFGSKDAHVSVQFVKYGIGGVIATSVDVVVFFLISMTIFPALLPDEYLVQLLNLDVPLIEEAIRERNFVINSVMAFMFSNLTAYLINVWWVFHGGRHSRHMEIVLFYIVSILSVAAGTVIGWGLIRYFGYSTEFAFATRIVSAILINFAGRKFIVFKG